MALSIIKRFSLEGIAQDWTDECHVLYRAVKYGELKALQALDTADADVTAATDHVVAFVKEHFVSGKGLIADAATGAQKIGEIVKEDIDELPIDVIGHIFADMTGQATDPKDTTPTTK